MLNMTFCFLAMIPDSEFESWLDACLTELFVQPDPIKPFMIDYIMSKIEILQQQLRPHGLFPTKHQCFVFIIMNFQNDVV